MTHVRLSDFQLARKVKRAGFQNALRTVLEARRVGLPLSYALATLEKESYRGYNLFGNDPVRNPVKGGSVTKARYLEYKRYRQQGYGSQGVGPTQLTYYVFQDAADALGGCWKPACNLRVGFKMIVDLIHEHSGDVHAAIRAYNGTGPAAETYANDWAAKQKKWHTYLGS